MWAGPSIRHLTSWNDNRAGQSLNLRRPAQISTVDAVDCAQSLEILFRHRQYAFKCFSYVFPRTALKVWSHFSSQVTGTAMGTCTT